MCGNWDRRVLGGSKCSHMDPCMVRAALCLHAIRRGNRGDRCRIGENIGSAQSKEEWNRNGIYVLSPSFPSGLR